MSGDATEVLLRIESLLRASVAIQLESRAREIDASSPTRKVEIVLTEAGLGPREIASLLGKNYDAVRKTIQRSRDGAGSE